MLTSRRLWGCLLVLGCWLPAAVPGPAAPAGRYAFQGFAAEDGLRNQAVGALAQDRDGFLWVGTDNRAFRFDGERFEGFGEKEGLPSSSIRCLQTGPDGRVWAGTLLGLARFDGARFQPVTEAQGLPGGPIAAMVLEPGAGLWIGTPLGPFRMEGERFAPVPGWKPGAVTALARGRQPGVWTAAWDGSKAEVRCWDGRGWRGVTGGPGFDRSRIDALAVDFAGTVWARSLDELWELPAGAAAFRRCPDPVPPTQNLGSLHLDGLGRLWVPAREALYCRENGRFTRITMADGLPRPWPGTVLVDREGSLWVGGYGLHQRRGEGPWRTFPAAAGGPALPSVWCFLREASGRMLAGTDEGLFRIDGSQSVLVPGTAGLQVRSLALGPRRAGIYMATSKGVLRLDPGTGRVADVEGGNPVLRGGRVYRLRFDRKGDLWAATEGRGLFRGTWLGPGRWSFQFQDLPVGTAQESFYDVVEDRDGRIWAAGDRGLVMLEGAAWRRFTTRDGLLRNQLAYLACTRNGELLIAYYEPEGITRARYAGGRLTDLGRLDEAAGLASNEIYLVGEDAGGRIWVGTDNGLDRIDAGGQVIHFGHRDGLPTDDINAQALLAEPGGDLWIGTASGPARFVSGAYTGTPDPPRTVILKAAQGDRPLPPGPEPAFAYAREGVQISYAATSYIQTEQLEHQVRMAGLEPEWRSTRERSQRYPGLAPGAYVFEVRARVGRGPWGPTTRLAIRVWPLWWQSRWFWGLAGLVLAGLATVLIVLRLRRLRGQALALETEVRNRTAEVKDAYRVLEVIVEDLAEKNMEMELKNRELEEARDQALVAAQAKTRFLSTMSHEIRTPINGVLGGAELLAASDLDPRQKECLDAIVHSGDSLLATLNDLLDFAKLEAGELQLEAIPFDLATLAFDVIDLMRPRAAGKQLEFIVDLDPALPDRLVGDPTRLRQTLGNLVSNAIKFTDSGQVLVRVLLAGVQPSGDRVAFTLAVTDTGTGIPAAAQARLFEPFTQLDGTAARKYGGAGMGLALCRRFLDAMGGRIALDSAEGRGSTFTLFLELPVAPGQAPAAAPDAGMEGLRALVADSSPQGRHVAGKRLAEAGIEFELVETGRQALERAQGGADEGLPFDLAIFELQIPAGEAAALGQEIRLDPRLAGLGLIYVSPLGRPGEGAMMEGAGFDAYLVSPVRQALGAKVIPMAVARRRGGGRGGIITRHTVAEAEAARRPGARAGEGLRALLAEDNETNQKISTRMLADLGIRVTLAEDGFQVLSAMAAGSFDLIFMDCQMPGMDGFTATRRVREAEQGGAVRIPIIAMTANALEGDRELCLAAGMDDFLSKPFTRQGLQDMVGKWRPGGGAPAPAAPAEPAPAEAPFWDEARFLQMKDLFGTEPGVFFEEILGPFEAQANQQILDLRAALAEGRADAVRLLAHTMKGASRNLGFTALGLQAEALERLAKAGSLQDAPAIFEEMTGVLARVVTLLDAFRA